MAIKTSKRLQQVKPSATLAVAAKAAELKSKGLNVIGLGTGEPDFDTPENIKRAAIDAIQAGFTKYTAVDGIADLKLAIINKFKRDNQLEYQPNQICVSTGAKQAIYNLAEAYLDEGDEVIIPAPYWVSYPEMIKLCGGTPVIVTATIDRDFKITAQQLEQAITPNTRLFIINSPSNPSGKAYTKAELRELGEVLMRYPDILVATDDIYEYIQWTEEPFCNILNACPELYDRTIVFNGVSKAYAMTGWRIGYAAGPRELISAMTKIQSQSTSNACSIAQKASVEALNGPQTIVGIMIEAFKARHDMVCERLNAMDGVRCIPADGTFYSFPSFIGVIDRLGMKDDIELATFLLEKAHVAVVPGSAFGAPGCLRFSFATSMEILTEALNRIEKAISEPVEDTQITAGV